MSVGTPYKVATEATSTAGTTAAGITTNVAVAPGDTLFVWVAQRLTGDAPISTVTGHGSAATPEIISCVQTGSFRSISLYRIYCPAGVASATALTVTLAASSTRKVTGAFAVPGLADANVNAKPTTQAQATTGTPTTGTASAAQSIGDAILLCFYAHDTTAATETGTVAAGFTKLGEGAVGGSSWEAGFVQGKVLTTAAIQGPVSYTPSLSTTTNYETILGVWVGVGSTNTPKTLSATQAQSATRAVNAGAKGASASQTQASVKKAAVAPTKVASQAQSAAVLRGAGRIHVASQGQTAARIVSVGAPRSATQGEVATKLLTVSGVRVATLSEIAAVSKGVGAIRSASGYLPNPGKRNTAEGQASGTTPSTANTGGSSGDAFSSVSAATNIFFDNTVAMHESQSYKYTLPTSSISNYLQWNGVAQSLGQAFYGMCYVYVPAVLSAGIRVMAILDASGVNNLIVRLSASNTLILANAANTSIATSPVIPTNQWVRLEARCVSGASGEAQLKVWTTNPDSNGTPDFDSTNLTGQAMGTAGNDRIRYGNASATSQTVAGTIYIDDMSYSTAGWCGPSYAAGSILVPSLSYGRGHGPIVAATQAQAAVRSAAVAAIRATTQAQVASIARAVAAVRAASQAQTATASGTKSKQSNLSASQAQAASRKRAVAAAKTATQAQVASRLAAVAAKRSATQAQAATIGGGKGRIISATQAQVASLTKGVGATRIALTLRLNDQFARTITQASGTLLGTADTGQVWAALTGVTTVAGVDGVKALLQIPSSSAGRKGAQIDSGQTDVDLIAQVGFDQLPVTSGGNVFAFLGARLQGNADMYRCGVFVTDTGLIKIRMGTLVGGSNTTLGGGDLTLPYTYAAGDLFNVRFLVVGSSLQGKAWKVGDPEPSAWQRTATDSTFTTGTVVGVEVNGNSTQLNVVNALVESFQVYAPPLSVASRSAATGANRLATQAQAASRSAATTATRKANQAQVATISGSKSAGKALAAIAVTAAVVARGVAARRGASQSQSATVHRDVSTKRAAAQPQAASLGRGRARAGLATASTSAAVRRAVSAVRAAIQDTSATVVGLGSRGVMGRLRGRVTDTLRWGGKATDSANLSSTVEDTVNIDGEAGPADMVSDT